MDFKARLFMVGLNKVTQPRKDKNANITWSDELWDNSCDITWANDRRWLRWRKILNICFMAEDGSVFYKFLKPVFCIFTCLLLVICNSRCNLLWIAFILTFLHACCQPTLLLCRVHGAWSWSRCRSALVLVAADLWSLLLVMVIRVHSVCIMWCRGHRTATSVSLVSRLGCIKQLTERNTNMVRIRSI